MQAAQLVGQVARTLLTGTCLVHGAGVVACTVGVPVYATYIHPWNHCNRVCTFVDLLISGTLMGAIVGVQWPMYAATILAVARRHATKK
jgi:hypothetical protein